jgi:uracil-DNA glycosylase family 4
MDADQDTLSNPFGMDEDCRNCPALCESRERVVHGFGDVSAEFLVVGEAPTAAADTTGIPFAGGPVLSLLERLGLVDRSGEEPAPENAFLTHLTRCHHPERPPEEEEVTNCEPYLNGELRMINPEILIPVGERVLRSLAFEYTTRSPGEFDIDRDHATPIRGRGFELVALHPDPDEAQREAFLAAMDDLMDRDYRQTKGRRGR